MTFDGIPVRFRKRDFDHAFFESKRAKDDSFSLTRAERMDWVKATLEDPESERFIGWNNKSKRYDRKRRVAVVMGNYVVVIALSARGHGHFITAFVADSEKTLEKIRKGPKWA
jgi:hypothetical protein